MDLAAYLDRIGYRGRPEPTVECLRQLFSCQALNVPYENLDVQLGVPIDHLDMERIFDKVVARRRGGWCYELNGLLGWALSQIGFDVTRAVGGVLREVRGDSALGNHLIVLVRLDRLYLVDHGLGDGMRAPLPMEPGSHPQGALTFGLERLPDGYWRYRSHAFGYPPSFDFLPVAADEALLAERCGFLQTAPESGFVQNLICQIMEPEAVTCLTGRVLRRKSAGGTTKVLLASQEEMAGVLDRRFGIRDVDVSVLWPRVVARHEAVFGDRPVDQIDVVGM